MTRVFRTLSAAAVLFLSLSGCSNTPPAIQTGLGLDTVNRRILNPGRSFAAGQPFALLLRPVQLRDHYLEMTVYHRRPDNSWHRVRTLNFKGLDTALNYIQIPAVVSLPFPGSFRIEFAQLNRVLGSTTIQITPGGTNGTAQPDQSTP